MLSMLGKWGMLDILSMLLRIDLAGLAPLDTAEDEAEVYADYAEEGDD
jgi:hypothetical protein